MRLHLKLGRAPHYSVGPACLWSRWGTFCAKADHVALTAYRLWPLAFMGAEDVPASVCYSSSLSSLLQVSFVTRLSSRFGHADRRSREQCKSRESRGIGITNS